MVLALTAVGGAIAYQAAAREQQYRVLLSRGDLALRDGQIFGAIEAFSGAIALRPEAMLAHLRRGETYRQRGDLDAAARDFRKAAALDPSATRPLEALGDVLYRRQRFKGAADVYQSRLGLDDRSEHVAYRLALARYRDGDIDAALAALAQTLRLSDRLPDAYYLLGLCLRDKQRLPDAVKAFETAVTRSPGMIPAREELAELYGSLGRRTDELEQLQYIALLDRSQRGAPGRCRTRAGPGRPRRAGSPDTRQCPRENARSAADLRRAGQGVARDGACAQRCAEQGARGARTRGIDRGRHERSDDVVRPRTARGEPGRRRPSGCCNRRPAAIRSAPESFLAYAEVAERQNHLAATRERRLIGYSTLAGIDETFVARATKIGELSMRLDDPAAAAVWLQRALDARTG